MRTVRFPAPSKEYDVIIGNGAVSVLGTEVKKLCPGALKALIVSETNVAPLYLGRVRDELVKAGIEVSDYVFEAGEKSKGIEAVAAMWNRMAEAGFTRTDIVIGLGGGVTTDMAGFAAATFLRGISVIQIPTSLLAMVDASIGGKTGIDIAKGKNQVGAFWQPSVVIEDISFLKTLPDEVFTEGMGEVIKHAFIVDPVLLEKLEKANGNISFKTSCPDTCIDHDAHALGNANSVRLCISAVALYNVSYRVPVVKDLASAVVILVFPYDARFI